MTDPTKLSLLVRAGPRICALSLADVVETMRPGPIEPLAGAPEVVRGLAVIRGAPVPVVDLASLLGDGEHSVPTRFVTVRTGERNVALLVDEVMGIGIFLRRSATTCHPFCALRVRTFGRRSAHWMQSCFWC